MRHRSRCAQSILGRQPSERAAGAFVERNPSFDACILDRMQKVLAFERQIALQTKDDSRFLEVWDLANFFDVLDDQLVRLPHICKQQSLM